MRLAIPFLLCALPAHAWEAGTRGALCTLSHAAPGAQVLLTFDPSGPEYSITVTRDTPWPTSGVFAMQFSGGQDLTISTTRHLLSDDARSLTVRDSGFGNVLRGLSANDIATALTGDAAVSVSLAGAAPEVAAFEACSNSPAV